MKNRLTTTAFVQLLAAVAVATTAVLGVAAGASASSTQPTMLQDDAQLVNVSQATRDKRLNELKALGVEIVKVRVNWRSVAPKGKHKPKGFNGADPNAYPKNAWVAYDAIVEGAQARGLRVLFQLGGSAPEWATPGKRNSQIYKPNATEFGKFVQAVGTRYSGRFGASSGTTPTPGPGGGTPLPPLPGVSQTSAAATAAQASGALPRVSLYSVWNEPNLASWLSPQTVKGTPYSPRLYRNLLYAASNGLRASGHAGDQLLIGELLPFAGSARSSKKIRPIAFLRELACVDSHYRPYRGSAAKKRGCTHFKKIPGTGLAYHPYTLGAGPSAHQRNRDDASIGDLGRVTRALDKLASRGRLARKRMPIWITEFGFQSNPPDRFAGVRISRIPGYMAQSEWIAYHNRRVVSYSQYPLVDDPRLPGFQSGLRFKNGRAKKGVYAAFRHTFYVRRSGSRVELFGCERAARSGNVTVQARSGPKGAWKTIATIPVNALGYFDRKVHVSGVRSKQFRYQFGKSTSRVVKAAG